MKKSLLIAGTLLIGVLGNTARAQNIYTFAGSGSVGYTGNGGPAAMSTMNGPAGIVADTAGNIYFADSRNNVIRKVSTSGVITTIAGTGTAGYTGDGGAATAAELRTPAGLAIAPDGTLLVTDNGNNVIRMINPAGMISTIAGTTGGYSGDGGPASAAQLRGPNGIVLAPGRMIIFSDARNNVIRAIDSTGTINTIAGNNTPGYSGDGGPAVSAQLSRPAGLAISPMGLFVADSRNHVVRIIDTLGNINTYAGTGMTPGYAGDGGPASSALLHTPVALYMTPTGNLLIGDSSNTVRSVNLASGMISTIAGTNVAGYSGDGGAATLAKFTLADGITMDHHANIYLSTYGNDVVRRIGMPVTGITISSNMGDTICFGNGYTFTATPVADSLGAHYQWLLNGMASGTDSINFTPATLAVGDTISCELMFTAGGTPVALSNKLVVDSLPRNGAVLCPPTICIGSVVNLGHAGAGGPGGGGAGGGMWLLSDPSLAMITTPPARITGEAAGSETIYYIMSNMCGTDTSLVTVTVTTNPYGTISGPSVICSGTPATFTDPSSGGVWALQGGGFGSSIDSVTGVYTGFVPGEVHVTYGVPGCVVTDSAAVTFLFPLSGPASVCNNTPVMYVDTPSFTTLTGTWSVNSTVIGTIDASGNFTGASTGVETISYTLSSACYATIAVTVDMIPAITGPSTLCPGNAKVYADSEAGGTWVASPTSVGNFLGAPGNFMAAEPGVVVLTYNAPSGCVVMDTVTVDSLPAIAPITGATHVDSIWSIMLSDATTGGVWTSSDPAIATVDASGNVTGVAAGVVTISYAVTNSAGCTGYVTYMDTVINAAAVPMVINNSVFGLYPNPAAGTVNLHWSQATPGTANVIIADVTGKTLSTYSLDMNASGTKALNISNLSQGVYLLTVNSANGNFVTKLVVTE